MSQSDIDFLLTSYDYELTEERIAQYPPEVRGTSRLFVLDRASGRNIHADFSHLPDFLPKDALLVVNNSRVVPARLFGQKPSGGKCELLVLTPPPLLEAGAVQEGEWSHARCGCLLRPGRSIRVGDRLTFGEGIAVEVLVKKEFGQHDVELFWKGDLVERMTEIGRLPLPPYIKRDQENDDLSRYQTLYASPDKSGSVAAPTAGLHFTDDMRSRLKDMGVEWAEVTLHVGYGTFSPVREEDIREHPMHSEYVEISPETAAAIRRAKAEGRPVIAVGTTSCRTIEGCALQNGG